MKRGLLVLFAVWAVIVGAVVWSQEAHADDVLCSSNMAYRNSPGHVEECRHIGINSHGGGGGPQVAEEEPGSEVSPVKSVRP